MAKTQVQQSLLTVVDGSMDKLDSTISIIDEAKVLNEQLKASNSSLLTEEKASILESFINKSGSVRTVACDDGRTVITGKGMIGYNVTSVKSGKKIGLIKAFDADANVVFQAYGSSKTIKLGKLTADGVKRITKTEA